MFIYNTLYSKNSKGKPKGATNLTFKINKAVDPKKLKITS